MKNTIYILGLVGILLVSCGKPVDHADCANEYNPPDTVSLFLAGNYECYITGTVYELLPPGFSNPNNTFEWSTGDTTNIIYVNFPDDYSVAVTDSSGSSTSYNALINVDCGSVYIPSAFTPDGDATNDTWQIVGQNICNYRIAIFTLEGSLVTEINGTDNPFWDGDYNGVPAHADRYPYAGEVVFIDGTTRDVKGEIHLFD